MNYSEQMNYLIPGSENDRVRMIDILERAGFSNKEISQQEFEYADKQVEQLFAKKKKNS